MVVADETMGEYAVGEDMPKDGVAFAVNKAVDYDEISFDPFMATSRDAGTAESAHALYPCTLRWDDLKFAVGHTEGCIKKTSTSKQILHGISGAVKPTELLAIMGSSGAGKTTLLNMLAGRLTSSKNAITEGRVTLNGEKRDFGHFKRLAAYVEQDDNMFAEMSVREQIEFSANLRLPMSYSKEKKAQRVENILAELGLTEVADVPVGSSLVRGISGGQRRRVNIGTELVTEPSLVFLDEPTSGLDAFNALMVINSLRNLAQNGRTVITTIHQPRSNIFTQFDKLMLLSEGRVMYFGPAQEAVSYFEGLRFKCPSQFNPADYFIDLLSVDPRSEETRERTKKRIEYLGDVSEELLAKQMLADGEDDGRVAEADAPAPLRKYASSYMQEIGYLCQRQFRAAARERTTNVARFGQNILFSLLLGLIWLNVGRDFYADPEGQSESVQAILGVIFFVCVNQTVGGMLSVIFVYPTEKAVVMRERASGSYRVTSYLLSKTIVELPRSVLLSGLFTTIAYWMIGLMPTARGYLLTIMAVLGTALCSESIAMAISTLTPTPQIAMAFAPIALVLELLFAGFFIQEDLMPVWLRWLQYLSYVKYSFGAVSQLMFEGTPFAEEITNLYGSVSVPLSFALLYVFWAAMRMCAYLALRVNGPKYDRKL